MASRFGIKNNSLYIQNRIIFAKGNRIDPMSDIIQILPDSVANQIAAGEVIQRPASVVKELMENAVDAGAKKIQLIVKDAGKTLIQVIDDGKGMSETDARLCFERHATSKIRSADDLFDLLTFGFRGEALASIAAVAKVSLKTATKDADIATCIEIEGSSFISQKPCQGPPGTNISVKNLFYNVPARRKFLKSDASELRYIIQEFQRVALVHPEIEFIFHQNGKLVFHLAKGTLKERIVALFGKNYNHRLVHFEFKSDAASVKGYVSKPEFAKRKRGEQYLFVNGRFFKHSYFHHAVMQAFEGLIQKDYFPSYFVYFEVNPADLDVNIHPAKTEINFKEQQYLYAMLRSSVKEALGRFNIAPAIDFDTKEPFDYSPPVKGQPVAVPKVTVDPSFNPFEKGGKGKPVSAGGFRSGKQSPAGWENIYAGLEKVSPGNENPVQPDAVLIPSADENGFSSGGNIQYMQVHSKYILTGVKSGLMFISQHRAHYRIRYDELMKKMENSGISSQQLLFEVSVQLTQDEDTVFKTLLAPLAKMGFEIRNFGPRSYLFSALPVELPESSVEEVIHQLIDDASFMSGDTNIFQVIAKTLAKNTAIKSGKKLEKEEMENLVNDLFSSSMPEIDPDGKPIIRLLSLKDLDGMF